MRIAFLSLLILGFSYPVLGQGFTPLRIDYLPPASQDNNALLIDLSGPIPLKAERGRTLFALRYTHIQVDHAPPPSSLPALSNLNRFQLSFIRIHPLGGPWIGTFQIAPGYASDSQLGFQGDDFQFAAAAFVTNRVHANWGYGFGLSYHQYRRPDVLPVLRIDWRNGRGAEVNALLPAQLRFWKNIKPKTAIGITWDATILPFRTEDVSCCSTGTHGKWQVWTITAALKQKAFARGMVILEAGPVLRNDVKYPSLGNDAKIKTTGGWVARFSFGFE